MQEKQKSGKSLTRIVSADQKSPAKIQWKIVNNINLYKGQLHQLNYGPKQKPINYQ